MVKPRKILKSSYTLSQFLRSVCPHTDAVTNTNDRVACLLKEILSLKERPPRPYVANFLSTHSRVSSQLHVTIGRLRLLGHRYESPRRRSCATKAIILKSDKDDNLLVNDAIPLNLWDEDSTEWKLDEYVPEG